ncbi:MAG: beta strand repeat-containing protein [Bacteroidia bacterium]
MEKTITTFNQRRALKSGILRMLLAAMFFITTGAFAQFNDGYLTVFKVTNTAALANTGTAIVAEEYIPTTASQSAPSFSVALPAGTSGVVISGTASAAGALSRSENGRYLIIPGYAAAVGAANSTFTSNGTARTLSGNGTMGAGVTGTFYSTANDLRGATSDDGTNFWFSGGSIGTRYTNNGTTVTTVSTSSTNTRVINIFNGQLYYSTSSTSGGTLTGVYSVGTGKPVAASTTSANLVNATAPLGFAVSPDARTIYTINATDKVVRYTYSGTYNAAANTYSGGSWSAASTGMTLTTATGVAVDWNNYAFSTGANGAVIYATSPTLLVRGTDNGTAAITATTLRTISGNNAFRGLAFSPIRQTVSKSTTSPVASSLQTGVSNTVLFGFTLTANEGNSTIKKLILNQLGTAIAGTDITNFRLLEDTNNNGAADTSEITAALATGTVNGTQITFAVITNTAITQGNAKNYLVIGNVSSTATSGATFIPSIVSDKTLNSIAYTTNLVNAGASYVTIGTSVPTGSTLTIAVPTIAYTGTLDALTTTQGTASATTSFSISGQNLTAGIGINPPAGFEISTTANFTSNVGLNGTPITVGAAGTVTATTIYVRLAATTPVGSYSGDIIASSTGAESAAIATASSTVTSAALANQTITFSPISDAVYGDAPFTVSATASSGLAVTYSSSDETIATVSGNTVTIVGVGEVTIYADQSGNSSYNPAPQAGDTFTVSAKALTVSNAVVTTKVYDGTNAATITGATLSGVVPGDTVSVSGNGTFADVNAGENIAVATNFVLAGNDSAKYTLTQPSLTGTISKAEQVITFGALPNKTTADADFALGATSPTSAINAITYSSSDTAVATIVGGNIHIAGPGTATITATQAASQNYNAANATQTLTVIDARFTDGNLAVVVAASSGNNTTVSVAEVSATSFDQTAPVKTITVPGTGASAIRFSSSATSTGYVTNSADGKTVFFTGLNSTNTSANSNTLNPRAVVAVSHEGAVNIATTYTGTSGNQPRSATSIDNTNYYIADQGGLYTNNATVPTVTTNLRSVKPFGGMVYGFAASSSVIAVGTLDSATATAYTPLTGVAPESAGQDFYMISSANNGTFDVLYILTATSNTAGIVKKYSLVSGSWTANGTYATTFGGFGITAKKEGTATHIYITSGQGALTANKVMRITDTAGYNQNIAVTTADNKTLYTAAAGTIIKGIAFAPLSNAPVITSTTVATAQAGQAFTYTVTATNTPASFNATGLTGTGLSIDTNTGVISGIPTTAGTINVTISATNTDGTGSNTLVLTVNPGDQTITFPAVENATYGDASFALTATATSGLAVTYTSSNTAVATVSGSDVTLVGAGEVTIYADQAGNSSYNAATQVSQTFTVAPKALTVSGAVVTTKVYDGTTTAAITGATPVGVINDDVVTVSGNGIFADANVASNISVTANLILAGTNSANYTLTQPTLTGTITPAEQVITFGALPNKNTQDVDFAPGAASPTSAVNAITYTSSNPAVATIVDGNIHIVGIGTATITAAQAASQNYNAATATQTLIVVAPPFTTGNLIAVVAAASANNTTASVIEVSPATASQASPINTIAIPGTGTSAIRISGSATSTGYVTNSADGTRVFFTGVNNTSTSANANTLNPRAVVSLKRAGASSLSIATTYTGTSGNQTRSATTVDNLNYFIADQGGLFTNNATTASVSGNYRGVKPFGTTVYAMTSTAIGRVSGYASGSTFTALGGITLSNPTDYYFVSSNNDGVYDVLYYIINNASVNATYYKYVYNGTAWEAKGTYATTTLGGFGLVAKKDGANTYLYVTTGTGASTNNSIVRLTDAGGTGTINITGTTTLYTTTGNSVIKGLAFAPTPEIPAITSPLTATAQVGQAFTYAVTATNTPTAYSATGLKGTGLSIDTVTGVISGTPATTTGSPISVTVSATNADGTGSATVVITVTPGTQVITFDPLAAVNEDDADFSLTATASSGLAVTYTSSNTSVAVISGTTVQIVGVGTADITASQAGNADYLPATDVIQTLTVNSVALANQTITFPAIANAVYGDAPVTLTATASSGLTVTYTTSDANVATVSGDVVTIVGAGEVTIYADQAGDSSYNPAAEQSQTFTVAKKALTVTGAVVNSRPYDGTDIATITGATLDGVVPGDTVTVSGNGTFADANAGENKTVTSNLVLSGDNSANYTLTQPALTGTITKADQVITFAPFGTKTTLDADFAAGATSATSAVNPITYTSGTTAVATVTAGTIHIVSAGTSIITASQEGNQNYNAATAVQTLTVVAPQFTAGNIVVLRAGSGAAALSNAATPVYFSEYTTSGAATVTIPVPSATAGSRVVISGSATSEGQINLSGDGQYLTVTGYDAPVGIASIAGTASATYNRVVGRMSANAQFAVTSLGSSLYTGNNIRSAATQDGSRYWTAGATGGIYTIENGGTAATQVISAPANTRTVSIFNGQLYVSSSSGTAGIYTVGTGLPTASTTTAITAATADPYAYSIVDRGNGVRNMYVVSSTTTIGLTKWVSTNGGAWTQAGTAVPVSGVAFYGIAARVSGSAVEVYASAQAGVYALIDTADAATAVSSTFTQIITAPANTVFRGIAFAPGLVAPVVTNTNLSISGALNQPITSYTITAVNAPATYNATGLPDGVTVNTQTGVISGAPLHAGVFNVTLSATNAAGTGTAALTFTVEKGDQVITFDALPSKDVNDPDFDLTATSATEAINPIVYTSSNPAVATVTGATVHIVGIGSAVITASQPATADYNAAIPVNQTLVVTSASLANQTISFDPLADQTYGNAPFELAATATSGLAVTYMSSNPAIASVSGTTVTIHNVGTVNITASQSGDSNYNAATDVVQPLNILAKPLTVTGAVVTTKVYDGTAAATVTGATLFGIVGTDEVTLVAGTATFSDVNAGTNIPVTTTYTLTGAQAYRYTIVQPTINGTITKANQAITFAAFATKSDLEPAATLTSFSTTSAVNTVTYTSSNPAVAAVNGTTLTITGIGTAIITASQADSQNYNAGSTSQTLTVQKGLYLNQFTGASACPTNGNLALAPVNATGTEVTRTTITCQSTGNVFNSTTLNATATVNDASYIEFSVSAAAGNKLNLKSLYFFRQASNSAPSQLAIRYSTDGFATSNYVQYNAPATPTTGTYLNWDFADFSTPVGGTVTFRLYPYGTQRADGTGASSNTGTFRIDDVTVFGNVSPNCYDWIGTVSTDWNTGGNWCGGEVPTTLDDVVIAVTSNNPVIASGIANAHNLTVNTGAALIVKSGTNLNVDNILTVATDATLTVEDGGALVQGTATTTNANSGKIVFNKKSSSLYRLDYTLWASPVAGQNLQDFSAATSSNRFYAYNTATDAYTSVAASTTDFDTAKGYLIRMPNADGTAGYNAGTQAIQFNGTFTGEPHNGTISQPLSTEGTRFSAVGNPYPSPINLADFFTANAQSLDASSGIYLWRKRNSGSSSSYATLSLSAFVANPSEGGGSENEAFYANPAQSNTWLIAPGQGFIVKAANTASPVLNFTNTMRRNIPVGGVSFLRTGADTASRMWINLTAQNGAGSQTAIAYMEGTTTGFDLGYDARKFAENNTISLYSVAENTSLTIQARPQFITSDVVPMGYVAPTATTYTVSLNRKDGVFAQGQNIYLKDKVALTLTNLSESAYSFATEAGTFNERFEIVYTTEGTLGNDDVILNPDSVIVYGKKGVININAGNTIINGVTVYDIRGAKVYSQDNVNNTQTAITNLTAEQQVLIVEVQTAKGKVSKRIVY